MGWKDTVTDDKPSWRDTVADDADAEPQFGATIDDDIARISKKYDVPEETLRDRQIGMGYYPEEQAQKLISQGKHGQHLANAASASINGVVGEGILGGLPSWVTKKLASDNEEAAIDELRRAVDHHKGAIDSIREMVTSGMPAAEAAKAIKGLGLGAKATKALTVGANIEEAARAGVMESDAGDELVGAAQAGGLAAGLEALPYVGKAAGWLGKKAGRVLTGVTEQQTERYLANPKAINEALPGRELKDVIDTDVGRFTGEAEKAKAAATDAVAARQEAQTEARLARSRAGDEARDAFTSAKERLNNVRPPESLADDVAAHIDESAGKLSELSSEAFDVLNREGKAFHAADLSKAIGKQMKALEISGVAPKIGPDAQAYGALGKFQDFVTEIASKNEGNISAADVKSLIQTLDSTSKAAYSTRAGELAPEAAENLATVRRAFDSVLKDSSEAYRNKMSELAPQVRLVSAMSKVFGDKQTAKGALALMSNTKSPRAQAARELLSNYDKQHGTQFLKQMDEYFRAQGVLKSPTAMNAMRDALPEYQRLAGELPEEAALKAAQGREAQAASAHEGAKAWSDSLNKLGPNSTENVVKSLKGGRNVEAQKQLEHLGEMTGKNYDQMIENSATRDAFMRDTTNGSRKTVLGSLVGGAVGSVAGPMGAVIGGAVGSAAGAAADKYGGRLYKAILDGTLKVGKYGPGLRRLYETRGPAAVAAAHAVLMKRDPDYANAAQGMDDEDAVNRFLSKP